MKTAHIHMNDQRLCQANVNVDARGRKKCTGQSEYFGLHFNVYYISANLQMVFVSCLHFWASGSIRSQQLI